MKRTNSLKSPPHPFPFTGQAAFYFLVNLARQLIDVDLSAGGLFWRGFRRRARGGRRFLLRPLDGSRYFLWDQVTRGIRSDHRPASNRGALRPGRRAWLLGWSQLTLNGLRGRLGSRRLHRSWAFRRLLADQAP
jgi:hypothetical protein